MENEKKIKETNNQMYQKAIKTLTNEMQLNNLSHVKSDEIESISIDVKSLKKDNKII